MTSRIVIPVLDSLEQNDKPLVKTILKGVKELQEQLISANSHTNTQSSFSIQPPSQNSILDRRIELKVKVKLARTTGANLFKRLPNGNISADGAAAGAINNQQNYGFEGAKQKITYKRTSGATAGALAPVFKDFGDGVSFAQANNFGARAFPLAQCMESIDLVINGTHFSVTPNQYITAVMKYTSAEYRESNFSGTAHKPPRNRSRTKVANSSADHLASPQVEGSRGNSETPNGFPGCYLDQADASNPSTASWGGVDNANSVSFVLVEPLFISPLMAVCGHGLTNVNNIDITIRWGNLLRCLELHPIANCINGGKTFAANYDELGTTTGTPDIVATIDQSFTATLKLNYYVAQDDIKIPNEIVLPYKQPQIHINGSVNLVHTKANISVLNNVRLNQIPDSCYIYARPTRSALNGVVPLGVDDFPRISNLSLMWKNRTGILSSYSERGLYEMFRDNGLDSSWDEVQNLGLVAKLEFGKDIPLDDNESPGTRGDYNWQMTAQFIPTDGATADYDIYQVFVMNGHAIVAPNECRVMTGVLDLKDNVSATEMGHGYGDGRPEIAGGSFVGGSEVGGSLIGGVAKHIKRVYDAGSRAKKVMEAGSKSCPDPMKAVGEMVKEY